MSLLDSYKDEYNSKETKDISLAEYLDLCKVDTLAYATSPERMLNAIGEPEFIDTSKDERLSRIHSNRTIKVYKPFSSFYGIEETIESVVSYYKHAAQGLEERKQVLYLLGPVGSAKSSIAEKLKDLMEVNPIYVLVDDKGIMSPIFESPLCLFDPEMHGAEILEKYGIPKRYLNIIQGPWVQKRLSEMGGDINKFKVRKIYPSKLNQMAISKTEPGDENNQDISSLVGKVDIRKLELFSQTDVDCYSFSGGLCLANQGLMEFVEMFKAPIKVLLPILSATQEQSYKGTEAGISSIPFSGSVLAHSNESEWINFSQNRNNEAFLDRIVIIKVPYSLRVSDEVKIYEKLLVNSSLPLDKCAPNTLKMLAQFMVLSRLHKTQSSTPYSKLRVYDGENLKDIDVKAKPLEEYKSDAGIDEGMTGLSTRFGFKIISRVFNYDEKEISANPVHLMYILQKVIEENQFSEDLTTDYEYFLKNVLKDNYKDLIGKEIQTAYLESYSSFGQNLFNNYVNYADAWIQEHDYKDNETGEKYDRAMLNAELEKLEKPAQINNVRDFRHEIVNYVLRYRASHEGKDPSWNAYEKIKRVIEERMFSSTEDLLPVISFTTKSNSDESKKHDDFVSRMCELGYTEKQVRLLVDWYLRVRKNS
jgi:serine protein kinase